MNYDQVTVAEVSDPPALTDADLARMELESKRLSEAFTARTDGMERLTSDDLATLIR